MFNGASGHIYQIPARPMPNASTGSGQISRSKESSTAVLAKQPLPTMVWQTLRQLSDQRPGKAPAMLPSWLPCPKSGKLGWREHRCFSTPARKHLHKPSPLFTISQPRIGSYGGKLIFPSNAVIDWLCNVKMFALAAAREVTIYKQVSNRIQTNFPITFLSVLNTDLSLSH